jgi:hypothetical protein
VVIPVTSEQAPRLSGAIQLGKLSRMLQSIVRRYPLARLLPTSDGFGVSLDAQTWIKVSYGGHWTAADTRDFLVLFATWLVADPARLLSDGPMLAGVLQTARAESQPSPRPQDSDAHL